MVTAIVRITDNSNRVLNIIKAKYNLKDKSAAIDQLAKEYEEQLMEPALRKSYIKKALKIAKRKPIPVGTPEDLLKRLE